MEKLISKSLLRKEYSETPQNVLSYYEARVARNRKSNYNEVSVFLSHKHGETEIIKEVITLLKKLKVNVYVDWLDDEMPKVTSGVTAEKIKSKIKACSKFIFLATEAAIASKWCNWEVGFGDSHKFHKDIAIMPITDTAEGSFSGSEYLDIYPIITSGYYFNTGLYYVEYKGRKVRLEEWLSN